MEIMFALMLIAAIVTVAVAGGLGSTRAAGWKSFEARHSAPGPLHGTTYRLPLCWFGTRVQPHGNCIRAHLSDAGIGLSGIGPFAWGRRPLLMPWSSVRTLREVAIFGVQRHELYLHDGVGEMGLMFTSNALPDLARHGVVPS